MPPIAPPPPQHVLYFLPPPQGQGSLRPNAGEESRAGCSGTAGTKLSVRYVSIDDFDNATAGFPLQRLNLPWEAAFLAGKACKRYRERGGRKTAPMPDFYIGAHAAVQGLTLLTRDARRYREYFPKLKLIARTDQDSPAPPRSRVSALNRPGGNAHAAALADISGRRAGSGQA